MKLKFRCCAFSFQMLLFQKAPLLFVFFLLFNSPFLKAQFNRFPIHNYSRNEYGKNQTSDNWCVLQGKNDLIYVGNASGILEYDGKKWTFIPVKSGAYVLSLAVDDSGKIFVGSQNEFGFLEPDMKGTLLYHSLSDSLPEKYRYFSNIIKTYVNGKDVIFQSEEQLFILHNNEISIIDPETSFHTSFVVNGSVYIRQRQSGLEKVKGRSLVNIDPQHIFSETGIFSMLPFDAQGKILIATQEKGLWLYDPSNTNDPLTFFKTSDDELLRSSKIYGGIRLSDGNFAFNTIANGVIILNSKGQVISVIDKEMGLRVNDVKQVIEDREHNLWLPLNNGISKVEYGSQLSHYAEESGLKGNVNDVIFFGNSLYVATSIGVFIKRTEHGLVHFTPVSKITGQIWNFTIVRGELIAGGTEGLYTIKKEIAELSLATNAYAVCYIPSKDLFFAGGQDIKVVDKNWKIIGTFENENNIVGISEDKTILGDSLCLWVATRNNGTFLLKTSTDLKFAENKIEGPPEVSNEILIPFEMDNKTVFGSNLGLLTFNKEKNKIEWLSDYKGIILVDPVSLLKQFNNEIWLTLNNQPAYIDVTLRKLITKPFLSIEIGKINVCYQEPSGATWIGGDDALIRYDPLIRKNFDLDFPVFIRSIKTSRDSVLFSGHTLSGNFGEIPVFSLSYSSNSITCEYAAPYFEESSKLVYSFRLSGLDSSWSNWSAETKTTFSNLHEGKYSFDVKAMNLFGKESKTAKFSFVVFPPWYRTVQAYLLYAVLFILFMYTTVIFNSRRLRKKNADLEVVVALRTNEVVQKNNDLEKQNIQIIHQKQEITDSINYAKRIQQAILPSLLEISASLPQSFVLFQPKDIVSGDFYFFYHSKGTSVESNYIVIAAADCTGHGVPGAMVSVVCSNALNRAVKEFALNDPGAILNKVRELVLETFEKSESEVKDGMDISLCVLYPESGLLKWAGANNPLWIIRKDKTEIEEFKADKQPIGLSDNSYPFKTHENILNSGDSFYVFTDGFADQFGGESGKKYKSSNFKKLILSIQTKTLAEQKAIISSSFTNWKGDLEQLDDVCVIGIGI